MLRTACLFILLLFGVACYAGQPVVAQPKSILKAFVKTDTTTVDTRQLDSAALNAYKRLPEFTYHGNYVAPSLWQRFWKWFWSLFEIKNKKTASAIAVGVKYFFIAAGVAALIFLVLKLSGIDVFNTFRRNSKAAKLAYAEAEENIHEIDFDGDIDKAVSAHNYRLAVRLLYLESLKQLSDKRLIDWQINKTNSAYINELTDARQREYFKTLTYQFEYVWYGDFTINSDVFKNISGMFKNFKSGIA